MRKEKKQAGRGEKGGRGDQEGRPKVTENDFLGAVKEWLTRKRKSELGENQDLRVKDCLGGVDQINESVTGRGGKEGEGSEGRRRGPASWKSAALASFCAGH